jgi:hypothetical protein
VTGPVEYVSEHACSSVNKLELGIKHSTNKALTLQGWSEGTVFSRLISGGSRSPEPVEGNAERASLPAIASRSGEAGGNPPHSLSMLL